MLSAYQLAIKAAEPTAMEEELARIDARRTSADTRAGETALQRFWRRVTGAR